MVVLESYLNPECIIDTYTCGRILRGRQPVDFETLTDDPNRKIVMLMGPDGLSQLHGKNGYQILKFIGYHPDYIMHKLKQGTQFKLALFPESEIARPATWNTIFDLVVQSYPDLAEIIQRHAAALRTTSFSEIEKAAGYQFLEVEKKGLQDGRFMTYERFLQSPMSLSDVRAFLYFTVQLRELYSGDGYTYTSEGKRGIAEYAMPNRPLRELGAYQLINIKVEFPQYPD